MKLQISALLLAASVMTTGLAFADADDTKWIAQCMLDNKDEGAGTEVVQKYCKCMNDKMSNEETQSITQWEKTHPQDEKECSAKAGWK